MAGYIKFKHVNVLPDASTLSSENAGEVYFSITEKIIAIWNGIAYEKYGGGSNSIKDITFDNNILTIEKELETILVDFSDVASAEGTNRVLAGLRTDVNNLQSATGISKGQSLPDWSKTVSSKLQGVTLKCGIERLDSSITGIESRLESIQSTLSEHSENLDIHVTAEQKARWDTNTGIKSVSKGTIGDYVNLDVVTKNNEVTIGSSLIFGNYSGTNGVAKIEDTKTFISDTVSNLTSTVSNEATSSGSTESAQIKVSVSEEAGKLTDINVVAPMFAPESRINEIIGTEGDPSTTVSLYGVRNLATEASGRANLALSLHTDSTEPGAIGGKYTVSQEISNASLPGKISDQPSSDLLVSSKQVYEFIGSRPPGECGLRFRGDSTQEDLSDITDPKTGDIAIYGIKEYIYNNSKWCLFGDESIGLWDWTELI